MSKVVNLDWINNQACRLSQNIYDITNLFIMSNYLSASPMRLFWFGSLVILDVVCCCTVILVIYKYKKKSVKIDIKC